MKISNTEKNFLIRKYKRDGLNNKQINQRLISLDFEQEMIKFNKKISKPRKKIERIDFNEYFKRLGKI